MTTTTIPSKRTKLRNAVGVCLVEGAVDLVARLDYRSVNRISTKCGANLDYAILERAAHMVMKERETHGWQVWEINVDQFVDAYMKIIDEAADAPDQS